MIYFFSQLSMKNLILLSIGIFTVFFFFDVSYYLFFPETKGATRWIKLFNISLQPSEIIKPVFVIISSLLLSRYKSKQDYSFLVNILIFFTCFSYSTYTTRFWNVFINCLCVDNSSD